VKRLNGQWTLKVSLIDNLVEKTFLQLGCPRIVASTNPLPRLNPAAARYQTFQNP
jgi:hypothetical protein